MEEIEGSETIDENGMVYKLGRIENPNDKTLGADTRVYGFGPNSSEPVCISYSLAENYGNEFDIEKVGIKDCNTECPSPIIDLQKGSGDIESIAEEIGEKGVENAPLSKISDGEFSENGKSTFVEVSGPPNGFVKRNEVDVGKNRGSGINSNSSSYNEMKYPIVEDLGKEKEVTLCDEHKFIVGDLVWICTKTKSWWPGVIVDPSHVCNVAPKSDQNASLLVKYFGNNPLVWCSPMQLKPFVENFEHLSSQGKSRVFLGAVAKAVDEFGKQIKGQMICSCENGEIKDETFYVDKNVLSRFQPVNFLNLVKNLAWDETKTGMLELVKIRSHLSAFYRSLGHHQLPINQLHETVDDKKDSAKRGKSSKLKDVIADSEIINKDTYAVKYTEVESEKGFKSRERRRSKYLSYPYIDATNDVAVSNSLAGFSVSPYKVKRNVKKSFTKKPQMPIYQPKAPITPGDFNTPLIYMLSKLRSSAVECVFPNEESGFNRFFYAFRSWSFHDIYDPEMEQKKEIGEKSKEEYKSQEPLTSNLNPAITPKQKRRKKNAISTANLNVNSSPSSGYFDKNSTSGSLVSNFEAPGSIGPQNLSKTKINKVSNTPDLVQADISMVVLPDLNGNFTKESPFVENAQAQYITTPVNRPVQNRRKRKARPLSRSIVENVKMMGLRSTQEGVGNETTDDLSNNDENNFKGSSLVKKSWVMGLLASGNDNNKPEAKKRKIKEKTIKTETQASSIPDLNGNANVSEPSKKKRRRNKIISLQTDLNPCFTKVNMNGEFSGTALVLTFAQGFPVPSKEALIATFCGFGPLNETETKHLSDNRSAQVVFKNGSEAVEALKGIEKSSPFGPVLVKCQLRHLYPTPRPIVLKPSENTDNKQEKAPDLAFIKKNLEMMTSTLKKGGDDLSAEMRTKLENEINRLLKKVTVGGSTFSP